MPIRSIADLRKQVGTDWDDVSDEDLISSYAKSIDANPAAVAHQLGFGLEEGGKNSKRLSSSVDRYQAGLYGVGEELTKAVGLDSASDWLGKQRRANDLRADTDSLRAQQLGAVDSYKDVNSLSDFGDYAVGLGIQSAPYLAEAAIGGLAARTAMGGTRAAIEAATAAGDLAVAAKAKRALDIGKTTGATVASYPSAVGDVLSNQREQAGQTDPLSAFALGVPYAAANAVGLEGAAARGSLFRNTINLLDDVKGVKGGLLRTGSTALTTGLKEGGSELFQEGVNQVGRMAVDPNEQFFSDAAQERFKESFVGGAVLGGGTSAALGGWRRSQPTNEIQQVFQDTTTGTTPAPAVTETTPAATVAPVPPAPVVVGGTTDIAQANQAAQVEQQQADAALQQQAAREQVYEQFGIASPEDPSKGQFFGQKLFGPAVRQFADATASATQQMTPVQQELARAVTFANAETGNQLVKFAFNAADPAKTVAKAFEAVDKVLTKFQIGHVQSADEAGQILNTLSENAKGQQLEQINALHVALTGEDTSGFLAVQNATTKGAKDGQLQVQNPSGVGAVREQGAAGSTPQGNAGDVRPSSVQPVGAGSVPEGSLGLQVGQPAGEGVRTGTGVGPDLSGGSNAQAPQVTPTQELLNEQGQVTPAQAGSTSEAAVQPAGAAADGAGVQEPAGPADAVPQAAAEEVSGDAEKLADQMESITDDVMKLLIKPTSRMTEETAQKQRDFIFTLLVNGQYDDLAVMAEDFGIKPHQAKDWSAKAGEMRQDPSKLAAAFTAVAEQRGLTINELMARVNAKAQQSINATAEVDQSISTSREQGGPKDSDERKLREAFDSEKGDASEREVTDEGLSIKGRKSGESVQERYNAVETNQAKFLRLSKQLEKAEDANDQAEIDRLNAELDAVMAKGVEQADKRTKKGQAKAEAPATKREPESAEMTAAAERFKAVKGDLTQLTDDELAAVKARATKFNNKQLVGKVDAELSKRGVNNAVQEPSTAQVDVRERAGDGQAVGEGNARQEAAAESESKTRYEYPSTKGFENAPAYLIPAQRAVVDFMNGDISREELLQKFVDLDMTEAQIRSVTNRIEIYPADFETVKELRAGVPDTVRAGKAWDKVTSEYPNAPKWADLTDEQRANFVEFGEENWTPEDVQTELLKLAKADLKSQSKQFFDLDEVSDELDGISTVQDMLDVSGIPNASQFVGEWNVIEDPDKNAFHGLLRVEYGQYVGYLNAAKLSNPSYATEVALHEIGHAVDMAPHGGVYSSQPEMSVSVKDGKVTPVGAVARELYGLYQSNDRWKNFLEYPFDVKTYTDLDNNAVVEAELFAQIFAIYTNPRARSEIELRAPATAAFMKEVLNDIKSAKPLQIQKAETSAKRSLAFRNRSAGGGDQGAAQVPRQPAGRREGFAARGKGFSPEEVIGAMPRPLQQPTAAVATNTWAGVKKAGLALAITEDVVKLAQQTMKSAADYLKAQYAQQATRLKFELGVEKILQQYDKLPKHVQGTGENSANRLIYDMTFEGKWGFTPSYNQNVTLDPALVQRFNSMPDRAQQLIRDVFEHGHNALVTKQAAVKAAADKVFAEREADAQGDKKELAEIALERKAFQAKFDRILKLKADKPYAYLGRYGNYVAVAKSTEYLEAEKLSAEGDLDATKWLKENESNADHYMVSFAETQAEADRIAAGWQGTGKFGQTYASEKVDSSAYTGGGDLFLAFKRMENMITRKAKGELISGGMVDNMRKLLADMYLSSVAESSAHTSSLARKNIAGGDMDMMRNLATRGRADAHFLAALQHGDEVTDAMDRMMDEANANRREATPVLNELLKRQAQSMSYKLPGTLAQNLTQLSTVYYLSTSPAFYLQQLLQTAVLSLPFMAGRLGYFRSMRGIQQAYGDIRSLVKGLGVNEHVDFSKAPADVRQMLDALVGMGKIDIGIDSDAKARSSDQGVMSKVMRKLQGVNTRIETINRATAAIAAYRGYLQKYGADKTAAATQYAADVVSNTHGSYDGFNTPRALSSDVGRVVGQFKRFQIIQLSMLGKLIHTAFKGASPDEKAVARASLKYITTHMAVLGGALGVPFVSQLGNILLNVFGDDDEPKDLEQKLRELIDNEAVADLVLRGAPSTVGLESLGKKLAMENVASLLPFTDVDLTDRDALTKVYVSLLGPAAALSLKMADGLGMTRKGEYYKGLEMMLPTGISNAMKAARFVSEGVSMRNGDTVLGPDGISMVDAAFQAIGLPTDTVTDRQRVQKVVAETDKFYEDRASQIKLDYTRAFKKGDSGSMQDAREAWMELQDSRSRNGYTRQPLSTLFRAPMQQAKRERQTAGGVEFNKNNRRFVESLNQ